MTGCASLTQKPAELCYISKTPKPLEAMNLENAECISRTPFRRQQQACMYTKGYDLKLCRDGEVVEPLVDLRTEAKTNPVQPRC